MYAAVMACFKSPLRACMAVSRDKKFRNMVFVMMSAGSILTDIKVTLSLLCRAGSCQSVL